MSKAVALVICLALTGCVTRTTRPQLATPQPHAELPPHMVEVDTGLYSCERGYLIRQGRCIADADLPHETEVEISNVPSAGDGAIVSSYYGGYGTPYYGLPYYYGGPSYYGPPLYSTWVPAYGWYGGGWWYPARRFDHRVFVFRHPPFRSGFVVGSFRRQSSASVFGGSPHRSMRH